MTALVRPGVHVSELCADGNKFLEAGELGRATSLYMSAFRTHAASTMSHVAETGGALSGRSDSLPWKVGLMVRAKTRLPRDLIKAWPRYFCPHCAQTICLPPFSKWSLSFRVASKAASKFLPAALPCSKGRETLTQKGRLGMLLEITRALACLLAEHHSIKGIKLYLKAYQRNKSEIVMLVKSRQAQHLSKIVKAFTIQILQMHPSLLFDSELAVTSKQDDKLSAEASSVIIEFLLAISPVNREVQELQAAYLFLTGRFGGQCRSVLCSPEPWLLPENVSE